MPTKKKTRTRTRNKPTTKREGITLDPEQRMMIRPGSSAHDPVTGFDGFVTLWYVEMDGTRGTIFQPEGTQPDGSPHDAYSAHPMRLTKVTLTPEVYIPLPLLGCEVTHKISGITGTVVTVAVHSTGCLHLELQPKGRTKEGKKHKVRNFEINECYGHPLLDKKSREQIEAERKETPSPHDYPVERGHFV